MTIPTNATPIEIEALQELLHAREAENAKLRQENADLRHNVEVYRRLAFGPSTEKRKSGPEQVEITSQLHLFYDELIAEAEETAERKNVTGSITAEGPKPRKKGGRRKKFPEHLPQVTSRYELAEDDRLCACGEPLHEMGEERCRELERIELTLVHTIERVKYACRSCEEGVRVAPGPDRPFEKAILGVGFLAHLIDERFSNHMPYHRLEKKYAKEGVEISRSVLERSTARCAERLAPLYELLCKEIRAEEVIFTDDTPVTIARPGDRANGSKQGRIWIYADKQGRCAYDFTDSRKADGPRRWLDGFSGFVHADAYPGYDEFFVPDGATEVACWAHTRRKFVEAETTEPELAAEILNRIRELYAIERVAKEKELEPDELRSLRQEKALPILEDLRARLAVLEAQALPKSPLGKAVGYAQRQWAALVTYTTDGRLEIDNNRAERGMRPIAVGRKNWMFFQREGGGRTAAILFSLLRTAEAAGVNARDYFRDVLVRIDRERDFAKLLPHAWKQHFAGEVAARRQRISRQIVEA